MLPPNHMQAFVEKIMQSMNISSANSGGGQGDKKFKLTNSQILVLAGILGGVLQVDSVLIDSQQSVQIVLIGSLKRKTEMDKMLDQIGSMSFDDVMKAIIDHFS